MPPASKNSLAFASVAVGNDLDRRHDQHAVSLAVQLDRLLLDRSLRLERVERQPVAIELGVLQGRGQVFRRDALADAKRVAAEKDRHGADVPAAGQHQRQPARVIGPRRDTAASAARSRRCRNTAGSRCRRATAD